MASKRPKVKYAPRHWRGVFPGMVILFITVAVGAAVYITPYLYNLVVGAGVNTYLSEIANGQSNYHDTHDAYTKTVGVLRTDDGQTVQAPIGVTGGIVAVCRTGWVAYAQIDLSKDKLYSSSVSTAPTDLTTLKLPSCISSDELSGTTVDHTVTISNVKVVRATKIGAIQDGSATVKASREGATVTWTASNSCSKTETPSYRVRAIRQALTKVANTTTPASLLTPHDVTTSGKSVNMSGILNGMTYQFQVSGRCGANYPTGKAATVAFIQQLPTPSGIVGRWVSSRAALQPLYGKVASSVYVHYTIEAKKTSWTQWHVIQDNINPTSAGSFKFDNYTASYGDLYRVRAYTIDNTVYSPWSKASTVRFVYSYAAY